MTFPLWGPPPEPAPQAMEVKVLPADRPLIYMCIGYKVSPTPQTSYLNPEDARRLAALLLEAAAKLEQP